MTYTYIHAMAKRKEKKSKKSIHHFKYVLGAVQTPASPLIIPADSDIWMERSALIYRDLNYLGWYLGWSLNIYIPLKAAHNAYCLVRTLL